MTDSPIFPDSGGNSKPAFLDLEARRLAAIAELNARLVDHRRLDAEFDARHKWTGPTRSRDPLAELLLARLQK